MMKRLTKVVSKGRKSKPELKCDAPPPTEVGGFSQDSDKGVQVEVKQQHDVLQEELKLLKAAAEPSGGFTHFKWLTSTPERFHFFTGLTPGANLSFKHYLT